jgi:hypothetical protein
MRHPELFRANWRTSSHSGGTGNCVEIAAHTTPDDSPVTAVRDSKNPDGPGLAFRPDEWTVFTWKVKAGLYDV